MARTNHGRARLSGHAVLGLRALAALLVLLAIGADIAADSRCHGTPASIAANPSGSLVAADQDACDAGCVPDCYCCSTLSMGPACPLLENSGPAVPLVTRAIRGCSPGIRPLPYHPPLSLS